MKNLLTFILCLCVFSTVTIYAQDKKLNFSKIILKQTKKKISKRSAQKKKPKIICTLPQ